MRKIVSVLSLFILLSAAGLLAQTPTATLAGIVKDAQGALIQGAKVQLTSAAQGTTREGVSNSDGSYAIPDVLPGAYRAQVGSKGFATAQYSNVLLEAGRTFTLDASRPGDDSQCECRESDGGSSAIDAPGPDHREYHREHSA
jgi:hypothetical protein